MGFFNIILAVYVVALSLVPCSDGIDKGHDNMAIIKASSHSDADHPDHAEECTPFCNCTCCGLALLTAGDSFSFEIKTSSSFEFYCKSSSAISFSYSIWLPPKI